MNASTKALHAALIRALKGCLTAWETWLDAQSVKGAKDEAK